MLKYCSIGSGSCGNCHYIGYKDTNILIDAGLTGKKITQGLNSVDVDGKNLNGIFITHEHSDHIKGAGIISRKYDVPIFANIDTWRAMIDKIGKIDEKNMIVFENDKSYSLNDILIRPFSIMHDAADPVGFTIMNEKDEKIAVATDLGNITTNIRDNLKGSDLVVLESNYDKEMLMMGSYTYALKKRVMSEVGHLSNEEAANFSIDLINDGVKQILLAHLSRENNFPELAYQTSKGILEMSDIKVGRDVNLDILRRNEISDLFTPNNGSGVIRANGTSR